MEILILPIIGIALYYLVFYESKSDLSKLKEVLRNTETDELKIINQLISNELKARS